jgi:hypothetical protein
MPKVIKTVVKIQPDLGDLNFLWEAYRRESMLDQLKREYAEKQQEVVRLKQLEREYAEKEQEWVRLEQEIACT